MANLSLSMREDLKQRLLQDKQDKNLKNMQDAVRQILEFYFNDRKELVLFLDDIIKNYDWNEEQIKELSRIRTKLANGI